VACECRGVNDGRTLEVQLARVPRVAGGTVSVTVSAGARARWSCASDSLCVRYARFTDSSPDCRPLAAVMAFFTAAGQEA